MFPKSFSVERSSFRFDDHLLKVALAAHETVVESIAEAVKSSQPGPSIYTRGGLRGSASDHGAKTRPISLDQAL